MSICMVGKTEIIFRRVNSKPKYILKMTCCHCQIWWLHPLSVDPQLQVALEKNVPGKLLNVNVKNTVLYMFGSYHPKVLVSPPSEWVQIPGGPGGPSWPCDPVMPGGPERPEGPEGPEGPVMPGGPLMPGRPGMPGGPLGPGGSGVRISPSGTWITHTWSMNRNKDNYLDILRTDFYLVTFFSFLWKNETKAVYSFSFSHALHAIVHFQTWGTNHQHG